MRKIDNHMLHHHTDYSAKGHSLCFIEAVPLFQTMKEVQVIITTDNVKRGIGEFIRISETEFEVDMKNKAIFLAKREE